MKIKYSILLFLFSVAGYSQTVTSSCVGADSIVQKYRDDADKLNYRHIYKFNSPWQDSISFDRQLSSKYRQALIAVYNATALPARDTVVEMFNMHIVNPVVNTVLLVGDSSETWIKNLINTPSYSGNPRLDYYINKYSLKRTLYSTVPVKNPLIVLASDTNFNAQVLADTLATVNGIDHAEADFFAGEYDDILDSITPNYVWLVYKHGWGDCTAGCYYRRYWGFRVYNDCSVEYGGSYGAALVGIKENALDNENIKVYPNPLKDKLTIELNAIEAQKIKLSITNNLGQLVYLTESSNQKTEIDLSFLSDGIYFLKLQNNTGQKVFKIIKE